jgi:hypothetical protein
LPEIGTSAAWAGCTSGLYADPAAFAQEHERPSAMDVALGGLVPDLAAAPAPAAMSAG